MQAVFAATVVAAARLGHPGDWKATLLAAAVAYGFVYAYGVMSLTVWVTTLRAITEHRRTGSDANVCGEAALRNFSPGALDRLIFGAYGFTGTVNFAGIAKATQSGASVGLIFGLVFLFVGFCFKISAVPFHMWTPDVYEGAPTPVTAFFAAAPKVAGIAIFARGSLRTNAMGSSGPPRSLPMGKP